MLICNKGLTILFLTMSTAGIENDLARLTDSVDCRIHKFGVRLQAYISLNDARSNALESRIGALEELLALRASEIEAIMEKNNALTEFLNNCATEYIKDMQ